MRTVVLELVTVTTFGIVALFSSGASDRICLFSAVTAATIAVSAKMPSSRNEGFQVSMKYTTPLASWMRASHTSEMVWVGVGPVVVPALMMVVSKSVHAAWLRLDHWWSRSTPNALSQNWPQVTCSFESPPQLLYG